MVDTWMMTGGPNGLTVKDSVADLLSSMQGSGRSSAMTRWAFHGEHDLQSFRMEMFANGYAIKLLSKRNDARYEVINGELVPTDDTIIYTFFSVVKN
jgi:hypothetical protein